MIQSKDQISIFASIDADWRLTKIYEGDIRKLM